MVTIRDLLKGKIPEDLIVLVRRSYDIIGDIAVIDIPKELEKYEIEIAKAIMKIHKNVKVVAKRIGITEGEYRIRRVKVILGENRTFTLHKENGLKLYLDINKVFYTPRLSNERLRIAKLVKDNEIIGDLFAGVGPYSILIAKHKKAKIYSVDLNPYAFYYLILNIKINKVKNINAYRGDSRKMIYKLNLIEKLDRVIMNIPKFIESFLDIPFIVLKKNGICHYYDFIKEDNFEETFKKIDEFAKKYSRDYEIVFYKKVGEIAPREYRVVVDFRVLE